MGSLRTGLRRVVPLAWRQSAAQAIRRCRDIGKGLRLEAARAESLPDSFALHAEITQPIMPGSMFENKLANLTRGAQRVHLSLIEPGRTWSFWRYVRKPDARNGFVAGRNLVHGRLTLQVGGGLCQLSSLMYHLGLLAGLDITERHAHSIDIYHEHERFTPLGADATVVWGFKDLRMANPHACKVVFECFVNGHALTGRVYAEGKLPDYEVAFIREQVDATLVDVNVMVNARQQARTRYVQRQGLGL